MSQRDFELLIARGRVPSPRAGHVPLDRDRRATGAAYLALLVLLGATLACGGWGTSEDGEGAALTPEGVESVLRRRGFDHREGGAEGVWCEPPAPGGHFVCHGEDTEVRQAHVLLEVHADAQAARRVVDSVGGTDGLFFLNHRRPSFLEVSGHVRGKEQGLYAFAHREAGVLAVQVWDLPAGRRLLQGMLAELRSHGCDGEPGLRTLFASRGWSLDACEHDVQQILCHRRGSNGEGLVVEYLGDPVEGSADWESHSVGPAVASTSTSSLAVDVYDLDAARAIRDLILAD